MSGALERLRRRLVDEGWTVTVEETTLRGVKHPGVLYRSLSPLDRATRGTLSCWSDSAGMHVRFRPDWLAALGDAGLLAVAFAITRGPAPGSRWADAAIAFVIVAAALSTLVPLLRWRFAALVARAVSSSDEAWERVRRRSGHWRFAWKATGSAVLGAWVVGRWMIPFSSTYGVLSLRMAAGVYRQHALPAAGLVVLAALSVAAVVASAGLVVGSRDTVRRESRSTAWLAGLFACLCIGFELDAARRGSEPAVRDEGLLSSTAFGFQLRVPDSMRVDSLAQRAFDGQPRRVNAHAWGFSKPERREDRSWQRVLVAAGDHLLEGISEVDWNELAAGMLERERDRTPGGEVVEHAVRWRPDTAEYRLAVHDFSRNEFVNWRCLTSRVGRRHGGIVCVQTAAPTMAGLAGVRESLVLRDSGLGRSGLVGNR